MTALDQAFIKAYVQRGQAAPKPAVPAARPVPLAEVLRGRTGPGGSDSPEARRLAVTRALERRPARPSVGLPDAAMIAALAKAPTPCTRATAEPAAAGESTAAAERPATTPLDRPSSPAKVRVADLGIPRSMCSFAAPPPTIPLPVSKARPAARVRPERPAASSPPGLPGLAARVFAPPVEDDEAEPPVEDTSLAAEPELAPPGAPRSPSAAGEAVPPGVAQKAPAVREDVEEVEQVEPSDDPMPSFASPPPLPPSASGLHADAAFRPMLQTDRFAWPAICEALESRAGVAIDTLAEALRAYAREGKNAVAVAARRRNEGSTTLLLCAARRLAGQGLSVVLVDADVNRPSLAERLDLAPEMGWERVADGRLPLGEVAIESIEDRMALVPWCGTPPGPGGARPTLGGFAGLAPLRKHYDVVLVDLGPLEENGLLEAPAPWWGEDSIDGLLLVHNVRTTTRRDLEDTRRRLAAAGAEVLGVAENRV